jgi:hypothetical protein
VGLGLRELRPDVSPIPGTPRPRRLGAIFHKNCIKRLTAPRKRIKFAFVAQESITGRLPRKGIGLGPSSCVILVPVGGHIEFDCERALQTLERRGYQVRRVVGYSAIDQGRCQMATDAVAAGFEELMWIDSDVSFNPDDVEKLRAHRLPIVCGIYAKKSRREFACDYMPGTEQVLFGKHDRGLMELHYVGFGFTLTHRSVYETIRTNLRLPACNLRFGCELVPYFMPMLKPDPGGYWYLAEDYAFCERARQAGFRIMADTSVRLWHVGTYGFSWEDAGTNKDRFATYVFNIAREAPK